MDSIDTKDRLLDATIESIYKYGYSDTTVSKIGDIADVSSATIHHYFDSKDNLLEATMRCLLEELHQITTVAVNESNTPRGKLLAIVNSVLGDQQMSERNWKVWMLFWMNSADNQGIRRLSEIYSRRLYSNTYSYFAQLLGESGAVNVDEKSEFGTQMLISIMHGAWLSVFLSGNKLDIENARSIALESIEMILMRWKQPLSMLTETTHYEIQTNILSQITIEATVDDLEERKIAAWADKYREGSRIYIPHFPNVPLAKNIATARRVIDFGYQPVLHIASRNLHDTAEFDSVMGEATDAGVKDFLLLGGGSPKPAGDFDSVTGLLESGVLENYRQINSIGFAAHPERHPDVSGAKMKQALLSKARWAMDNGYDYNIVTQFCFYTQPFIDLLSWLQSSDLHVPVHIGVAGRVSIGKLMKYAKACGIGRSFMFLRRQFAQVSNLVGNYSPDALISEINERVLGEQFDFPVHVHFFTFGAIGETLDMYSDISAATLIGDVEYVK